MIRNCGNNIVPAPVPNPKTVEALSSSQSSSTELPPYSSETVSISTRGHLSPQEPGPLSFPTRLSLVSHAFISVSCMFRVYIYSIQILPRRESCVRCGMGQGP